GTALQSTVVSAGTPTRTGAVVSINVMCWDALPEFPHESVTVQVRVITELPVHEPGAVVCVRVIEGDGSQLSVAVGLATLGTASHCTVTSAGIPSRTGTELLMTVICCDELLELPVASVAVHVRVIV